MEEERRRQEQKVGNSGTRTFNYDTTALEDGTVSAHVEAKDPSGNYVFVSTNLEKDVIPYTVIFHFQKMHNIIIGFLCIEYQRLEINACCG